MEIIKRGWNLKVKIWISFEPPSPSHSILEMDITLKFTKTNLFLIKIDYFYIGNLYFFNWDSLRAKRNSHYKAWSNDRYMLILDLKPFRL